MQKYENIMAGILSHQLHRWNNRAYGTACPRVSFHYESDGLMHPAPYYFAVTTVNKVTGQESRMSPITRVHARRPFSAAYVSVNTPPPNLQLQVWCSVNKDYWHRVPILKEKLSSAGLHLMVTLLRDLSRVEGYDGQLGGFRGIHNVVLPKCGGNGHSAFMPRLGDHNDGNVMHYTEPLYKWRHGSNLEIDAVY